MARHHDRHGLCRAVRGPVRGHAGRRDGGIHAPTDARHAACARCAARLSGAQRLVRGQRQHRPWARWRACCSAVAFPKVRRCSCSARPGSCSPRNLPSPKVPLPQLPSRSAPCARCSPPIWSTARREPSHWGIANSPFPRTDAVFYRFRAGKASRYLYPLAPESARLRKLEHGPDARLLFRLLSVRGRRPRRGQARLQRPSAGSGNSDGHHSRPRRRSLSSARKNSQWSDNGTARIE